MVNVLGKTLRILGLDERKGRTVGSGIRFSWEFSGQGYKVFCLNFISLLD